MSRPTNLPEIIEIRSADETCSQFVFGKEQYYVDLAYQGLIAGGLFIPVRSRNVFPHREGDIVFYGSPLGDISHVARVDRDGLLVSKFHRNPKVYRHELWGDPIPPFGVMYERFHLFRLTSVNIPVSSNP